MGMFVQGTRDPGNSSVQPNPRVTSSTRNTVAKSGHGDFQKTVVGSIQDDGCEEALAEMLAGQSKGDVEVESFRIILKVLTNIVEHESDAKVRRLRMNNAKIEKFVVHAPGAMELLLACGFEVIFEQQAEEIEQGVLVLPEDVDASSMDTIRRVVRAIEKLLGVVSASPVRNEARVIQEKHEDDAIMSPEMRSTILELPTPVDTDVPEWFFEQSSAEIRQLYKQNREKLENSKILMTRAMRERLAQRTEIPTKATIRIRVRAPEGTKIVGDFRRKEPIQALFAWISDCLVDPMLEFDVILPDRRKLGDARFEQKTLEDVGLTASQTLNLCWQGETISLMKYKTAFRENI